MSKLHEWKVKHKKMTKEEKENCSCDMCKETNLYNKKVNLIKVNSDNYEI